MISIDFQAGSHGNFLEYVCNIAAGVETDGNPFGTSGAAHRKIYKTAKLFEAKHFSFSKIPFPGTKVIAITIGTDDLLPLSQVSLLRAGNYGNDNDQLEVNTFNKLNNSNYRSILDVLINSFFTNQIESSYNAVKDASWPEVKTINDFKKLPIHIQQECIEVHHLKVLELSPDCPDCPRSILREFFQYGFEQPEQHGFIVNQNQLMRYPDTLDVFEFPFCTFYNQKKFITAIESIVTWTGISYTKQNQIHELHTEFLKRQIYKDSKIKCDNIVEEIIQGTNTVLPKVNLLEESYINARLKKKNYERRY